MSNSSWSKSFIWHIWAKLYPLRELCMKGMKPVLMHLAMPQATLSSFLDEALKWQDNNAIMSDSLRVWCDCSQMCSYQLMRFSEPFSGLMFLLMLHLFCNSSSLRWALRWRRPYSSIVYCFLALINSLAPSCGLMLNLHAFSSCRHHETSQFSPSGSLSLAKSTCSF